MMDPITLIVTALAGGAAAGTAGAASSAVTDAHDQVLYPLTAHDQPIAAPAPVRAAWRAVIRHIDSTIAATRLGRAA